jgi:hypothetical protein
MTLTIINNENAINMLKLDYIGFEVCKYVIFNMKKLELFVRLRDNYFSIIEGLMDALLEYSFRVEGFIDHNIFFVPDHIQKQLAICLNNNREDIANQLIKLENPDNLANYLLQNTNNYNWIKQYFTNYDIELFIKNIVKNMDKVLIKKYYTTHKDITTSYLKNSLYTSICNKKNRRY